MHTVVELDEPKDRTLPALLRRRAEESPERVFLKDRHGELTYREMGERARRVAGGFRALGIVQGDHVAIMMDNRREFIEAWFGLALLGAVEVPVNQHNVGKRLTHILNHSQSRMLVVQAEYVAQVEEIRSSLEFLEALIVVDGPSNTSFQMHKWDQLTLASPLPPEALPVIGPSDPEVVMYTSGSTGPAKGAVLPHGQHYMNGYQPVHAVGITFEDRLLLSTPLHHNMGQGYGVMPALVAGASIYVGESFDRRTFWDEVRRSRATVLPFVGAMLVLLAKNAPDERDDKNSLRVGYGVPIPAGVHRDFEARFGMRLVHCYGSTEATIVAWGSDPDSTPGAAGRPIPGYEVQLMDEADNPVPPGTTGEICIRSEDPTGMFLGYFEDPERNELVMRNGWFHTGDQGRFDELGQLWFVDRLGDVIRCKGESVSAHEVEEVLLDHPSVSLAAAYGVPNQLGDQDIVAAVIVKEGHHLTAQELHAWSKSRLARYAMPRYVDIVSELPMTPTGKIEKYKLRSAGVSSAAFDVRAEHAPGSSP